MLNEMDDPFQSFKTETDYSGSVDCRNLSMIVPIYQKSFTMVFNFTTVKIVKIYESRWKERERKGERGKEIRGKVMK